VRLQLLVVLGPRLLLGLDEEDARLGEHPEDAHHGDLLERRRRGDLTDCTVIIDLGEHVELVPPHGEGVPWQGVVVAVADKDRVGLSEDLDRKTVVAAQRGDVHEHGMRVDGDEVDGPRSLVGDEHEAPGRLDLDRHEGVRDLA